MRNVGHNAVGLEQAVAAAASAIRPLTRIEELARCVDLQRAAFALPDVDLTPARALVVMREVGGLVLGAFRDQVLAGFVNCLPGVGDDGVYWRSHMMCVLPAYQNGGIGTALKLAQREHARRCGIRAIHWVFDPLSARNAYLNIGKLGARVRRYSINHYGPNTAPPLAGLDTDRVIAEWLVTPVATRLGSEVRKVAIPAGGAAASTNGAGPRHLQLAVRTQFQQNFADGFVVVACERHDHRLEYVFRREW